MASLDSSSSSAVATIEALRVDPALVGRGLVVEDVLGEGGSSIVYRAHDTRHGREVAVKVLRWHPAFEHAAERFRQEIRVAAGLRHAHILPLFDSGALIDGRLFLVMPVAQGRPLSAAIAEGPLAPTDAVRLTREIAQALAYLHARGYVHRDVKPQNVLVESGHAVLTDFGLAATFESLAKPALPYADPPSVVPSAERARFTEAGLVAGTPAYMSPESLFGDRPIDARADLYSLGVVLYEMLTGVLPFTQTSNEQPLIGNKLDRPPTIRALRSDVPEALEAVITRCLAVEPSDRFESADAMDAALAAVPLDGSVPTLRRLSGESTRRGIGAAALFVLLIVTAAWFRTHRASALDPQRIVVADLANDTGDSSLASVGALAGDFITEELIANTDLNVVNATVALPSRQQRRLPPADSTLGRQTRALISATRAGLAVTGAYFREGQTLEIVAEVTDTRSGRVIGIVGPMRSSVERPDGSLRQLADSVSSLVRHRHEPPVE